MDHGGVEQRAPPRCYESAVARRSTSPTRRRHHRSTRDATPDSPGLPVPRVAASPVSTRPAARSHMRQGPAGRVMSTPRVPERLGYPRHHWLREIADTNTTMDHRHDVQRLTRRHPRVLECSEQSRCSSHPHCPTHCHDPAPKPPTTGRKRVRNATDTPICSPNGTRLCRRSAALLCVPKRHLSQGA